MESKRLFSLPVRVYIEDTDAGGIVFYVNYLKFMERARTELLRSLGFDKPAITHDQELLVVASADVDYHRPALLDDLLTVTAEFVKIAKVYVVFKQTVMRRDQLLCSATIKVACVTPGNLRPTAMPEAMQAAIRDWHQGNEHFD